MKKVIITSVLVSWMLILFAQSNLQIVDPAKKWTRLEYIWDPYTNIKWSFYIKMTGDTVIDPNNYLRIWQSSQDPPVTWNLIGFAREDAAHHVYFRDLWEHEGLVYRFDINPGDTFTIINPLIYNQFVAKVLEVDTIQIMPSGEYRKRIIIKDNNDYNQNEEIWIEGVGSMAGINYSGGHVLPLTGAINSALCMWHNGDIIYSNPQWDDCFEIVSTEEIQEDEPVIIIQSNPLTDQSIVSVKSLNGNNLSIDIHNIFGKLVQTYQIDQDSKIVLHRSQFKSSLYIISLKDGNKSIAREKLLIQ